MTDQELVQLIKISYQQINTYINRSKIRSTDQKLDQKIKVTFIDGRIKNYINRSKGRLTAQKLATYPMLDKKIKRWKRRSKLEKYIDRLNVRSIDQKFYQKIKILNNKLTN